VLLVTDALDTTGDSFDLGNLDGLDTVRLTTVNGAQTIRGFNSGNTLQLTATLAAAVTPVLNGAITSASDVLNVSLINAANTDFGDLTLANIETINITTSEPTADATVRVATIGLGISQTTVANSGSGAAQTVNILGTESLTIDTAVAASTINASGMTVAAATDAGLTMVAAFTATTAIPGQTITGSGKVDTLRGSTGADVIDAGAGNDIIHGSIGADSINGGDGTDTYVTSTTQVAANIQGTGTGTSIGMAINLSNTAVTALAVNVAMGGTIGLSGSSTSLAAGSAQYVFGTQLAFNATTADTLTSIENITLAGNGNNFVVGSAGDNVIVGGTGNDVINGGDGNDTITGGAGIDTLTGGLGADTFVMTAVDAANADNITDFTVSQGDVLSFDISDMALSANDYVAGAGVVITVAAFEALAIGAAANHVIVDTAANILAASGAGNEATDNLIAIASDTGAIYYSDAAGDFQNGGAAGVIVGSITAAQAALITAGNLTFIA
jgi:Ca2+-binding RTX toxin-like protein